LKRNKSITEIEQNVALSWDAGKPTAQEFDVLYTNGYELVILECKAGKVKQDYLQKLENLRDTFSGA